MIRNIFLKSIPIVLFTCFLSQCTTESLETTVMKQCELKAQGLYVERVEVGKASWYSVRTNRGTRTASGQKLSDKGMTAAHKTLPMGTKVRVTNLNNKKSEIVTINDRGPYIKGRIIDVSIGVAEKLGFVRNGVVPTKVEVLKKLQS